MSYYPMPIFIPMGYSGYSYIFVSPIAKTIVSIGSVGLLIFMVIAIVAMAIEFLVMSQKSEIFFICSLFGFLFFCAIFIIGFIIEIISGGL